MSGQSSADDERLRLRAVQLTGRQATCLSLYYFDDLSLGQIARELHIHRTVVSQHLRYGRQKLSAGRLAPRRMRWAKSPMLIQMDIEALDELSPDYLRGRWQEPEWTGSPRPGRGGKVERIYSYGEM